jgi:CBS domain-containing protein
VRRGFGGLAACTRPPTMKIAELMTNGPFTCSMSDTLARAAQIMWDRDCGAVPVTDDDGRTVGIVTDRDICMAAYTQGKTLSEIPVAVAASEAVVSASPDDSVEAVAALMRDNQIRRVPVLDGAGQPRGIVGVGDIVRHLAGLRTTDGALSADLVARTLAAISQPRVRKVFQGDERSASQPVRAARRTRAATGKSRTMPR